MKKNYFFLYFIFFIFNSSFAQSGTWTWISGDSAVNSAGVFGTQGTPATSNHPPPIYDALEWKDKQGNFWIYGGTDTSGSNTDLWSFNPVTLEWTWVKGNGLPDQMLQGVKGVPSAANTPGARTNTVPTWVDTSGALWLCGGAGNGDDIWKFDTGTKEWTWIAGDTTGNLKSNHGTLGMQGPLVTPGNRYSTCSAWTDSLNTLWLFGGFGYDDSSNGGSFNDLMKFNVASKQWTWVKGSPLVNPDGVYGSKGISNAANEPMGRFPYTNWKDAEGNFWMMGGLGWTNSILATLNDVWQYDISSGNWTWMAGPDVTNDTGYFNASCLFDTTNNPASRWYDRSSVTDNCGRVWLFGGATGIFSPSGSFNDLWIFDPQQVKWSLVRGTNPDAQLPGIYGMKGVPALANLPVARSGAIAWWGNDNKFYMFGGADNQSNIYADMWVFDPDTTCIPSCNSVAVLPPVTNFQSSQTMFCTNSCINFTDLSSNATSWLWSFPGATDSTSASQNPQNICYATTGEYNVTLVASNAGGSDSVTFRNYINVEPAPPTPSISQAGMTLYCSTDSSYTSYQWYLDSVPIAGATDTSLIITQGGNYNVVVTNGAGCKIGTGTDIILGLKSFVPDDLYFALSPNPVSDELIIKENFKSGTQKGKLTIFNTLGEEIYTKEVSLKKEVINCKSFPAGIYFVQITAGSGRWAGRFVKE